MSEFYDEMNKKSPTYKLHRKETFLWAGLTAVVLILSWFFIWQMNNSAVKKINKEVTQNQLAPLVISLKRWKIMSIALYKIIIYKPK